MIKTTRILLIDDDISLCTVVSHQLKGMGYNVKIANRGAEGIEKLQKHSFDLVLLDLQMPEMHGMEVLKQIRLFNSQIPVIIITAYGTIENAVDVCRKGADDYLPKPFAKEQLLFTIEKNLRLKDLELDNQRLQTALEEKYRFGNIISKNKKMQALLQVAGRAAQSDAAVLITGESGTGKELLAKAIHLNSPRKEKPFVAVNCPSIPETLIESELFGHEKGAFTGATSSRPGKFEMAGGGTIFLDEIGDLKLDLQSKLLRVLQEHEIERVGGSKPISVDVRVISATNRNLTELAQKNQFRQDLYYRLNVIPLNIPPLRDREDDIPLLVEHFVKKYATHDLILKPDFIDALLKYSWPGNVRELENMVQRAVVLCSTNTLDRTCLTFDNKADFQPSLPPDESTLAEAERRAIISALESTGWNQTRAAEILNIPRHVLLYRMKKLRIVKNS